jgi:hypothetical protein
VAAGKTFAVETGATLDIRSLGVSGTVVATAPTTPADAPVKIDGTIEFKDGGAFIGLHPLPFADRTDVSKFAAFGPNGKLLFNYGATYIFGSVPVTAGGPYNDVNYIGSGAGNPFSWAGTNAQIIIHGSGINIRATDGGTTIVDVLADGAFILKEQTLFLDTGVELKPGSGEGVMFAGDTTNGGQLKGPGKIFIDYHNAGANNVTTITGGSDGWQAASGNIAINNGGNTGTLIVSYGGAASFKALGPSAVITQSAVDGNALSIAADTTIDLGGTAASPGGSIVLQADTDPAELVFLQTTSKVLIGPGTGGTAVAAVYANLAIGGKEIVHNGLVATDIVVLGNKLVSLGGTAVGDSITAGTTVATPPATNDVTIVSNAVFTNTN